MLNVFITGASTGIGAALARQYASRGAVVGLVARNRDKLEALADALPGGRDRNIVLPCDVTVREEVFAAAEEFERLSGGTTVVIANAGMSHGVKTEYLEDLDMLEDIYRLNVFAMAYTFHAFIGPMKARGNGQLVGIGSVAGIRGLPGSEAYCSSKAAVISYLESPLSLHIAKAFGLKCRNTAFAYQPSVQVSSVLRSLPRILIRCRSLWNPRILHVKLSKPLQLAPAIV